MKAAAKVESPKAPETSRSRGSKILRRKCVCGGSASLAGECDECRRGKVLQRSGLIPAPAAVPRVVFDVLGTTGQQLDQSTRVFMESRLGHDFSNVRVHTDSRAAESASAVGALAYTVGNDVVFAGGRYAPETPGGRGLLAHELVHVMQQQRSESTSPQFDLEIGPAGDQFEREADAVSENIQHGLPVNDVSSAPQQRLQRFPWGALLPIIGGAIGLFALLFREGSFTDRDLEAYLEYLATRRKAEGGYFSDNKARAVVKRWTGGNPKFDLDQGYKTLTTQISGIDLKRLLIQEMLGGRVSDGDEESIVQIMAGSTQTEILEILNPAKGLSIHALIDNLEGKNKTRFLTLIEKSFPTLGEPQVRRKGEMSCDARQAFMIHFAREQAQKIAALTIKRLTEFLNEKDARKRQTNFGDVSRAIACYFTGASETDVKEILEVFKKIPDELTNAQYLCLRPGQTRFSLEFAGKDPRFIGKTESSKVELEENPNKISGDIAQRIIWSDKTTNEPVEIDVRTVITPLFFRIMGPVEQASTLIHEAAHGAGPLFGDPHRGPGCEDLKLDEAKENAESFARLAVMIGSSASGTVASRSLPRVFLGNFRNEGALSAENECPVCPKLHGLGVHPDAAVNVMELRGDIKGHRPDVQYDFFRRKERAVWKRISGVWHLVDLKIDAADDFHGKDEDVTPKNNHIYSVDAPGFSLADQPVHDPRASEAVFRGTFTETVRAKTGEGEFVPVSNEFNWHSVTWMWKLGGEWERKPGANEIKPGRIPVGKNPPS